MNRIERMFKERRKTGGAALIPFITAGDPDLHTTEALILEMDRRGADLIELGLPFSDPLADGPTIQAASQRALRNNVNAARVFELVGRVRRKTDIPLVLMGYYNPVYRYGLEEFAQDAAAAGLDGTIVPDLPFEEAREWSAAARKHDIANILLVAPTTPADRAKRIAQATRGFLYYVSVTGITGARKELPDDLAAGLRMIKGLTKKPVAVGFGISRPDQVAMLSRHADGIIVGSAIVKIIEKNTLKEADELFPGPELVKKAGEFVGRLKAAAG